MTPERANALIEANLDLVHSCVNRFLLTVPEHVDAENLRGAAFEALVVLAYRYDPSQGKFSSFAWPRLWGAMYDELRGADHHSRGERANGVARPMAGVTTKTPLPLDGRALSFDAPDAEGLTLYEMAGGGDFVDASCEHLDLVAMIATLPHRYRFIVVARMLGITNVELAGHFGVSQGRVSQLEKKARARLREAA